MENPEKTDKTENLDEKAKENLRIQIKEMARELPLLNGAAWKMQYAKMKRLKEMLERGMF